MFNNKVAIITGATRGIGRVLANKMAELGCNIVVTGKTVKSTRALPGDIYEVSKEIENYGVKALPIQLNLRDQYNIKITVDKTMEEFGRIDYLINNAGALWWKSILGTSHKKYDLIHDINSRGSYILSRECIPYMLKNDNGGHIVMCSPPITTDINHYKNKTAYMISKLGMTMSMMGISSEYDNEKIAANSIWPKTPIESQALINHRLGNPFMWRKADIVCDAIINILQENPLEFKGNALIDEEYLLEKGETDFDKYNCVPGGNPPSLDKIHHMWNS